MMIKNYKGVVLVLLLMICFQLNAQIQSLQHREVVELTNWKFLKGITNFAEKSDFNDTDWNNVEVPHTYSMDAINDIGYYRGEAWYRTELVIPETMQNERVFIRFEGVGQEAEVYVNEQRIGKHIGGYSAFCYEISDVVQINKKNILAVKVSNAPNFKRIPVDDALFNHYGGVYRPVQLFSTPKTAISPTHYASPGVFVEATTISKGQAMLEVRTHISSKEINKNVTLKFTVKDVNNSVVIIEEEQVDLSKVEEVVKQELVIENPILWDARNNPYLYSVEVEVISNNSTDKVVQDFGIRSYKFDDEIGFVLNNEPYRLYGVCRHQEWKQNGPALTNEQHVQDMDLIDEIGATALRLAHYQQSDKMYEIADEKGIMVWAEIPFVHDYSGREGGNAKEQLIELILQNYNHPSIFVWGLWNEVRAWQDKDEPPVILTKQLKELAHKLDKTRLTTSASDRGMESNMGNITDLQAWNKYFGWYYGTYEDMGTWLDESHNNFPDIKIGVSEYGIGGNIKQQDANRKVENPKGFYFPEYEQSKYHEITWKILKERPFVWGTFVWNMFDFSVAGWNRGGERSLNHKGIVTFDRKVKKDAFYFYKANWSKDPMLFIAERRQTEREQTTSIKVYTNVSKITLLVNGKKVSTKKLDSDIFIINFENINLKKGENTIKVISNHKNIQLTDEVVFTVK